MKRITHPNRNLLTNPFQWERSKKTPLWGFGSNQVPDRRSVVGVRSLASTAPIAGPQAATGGISALAVSRHASTASRRELV